MLWFFLSLCCCFSPIKGINIMSIFQVFTRQQELIYILFLIFLQQQNVWCYLCCIILWRECQCDFFYHLCCSFKFSVLIYWKRNNYLFIFVTNNMILFFFVLRESIKICNFLYIMCDFLSCHCLPRKKVCNYGNKGHLYCICINGNAANLEWRPCL